MRTKVSKNHPVNYQEPNINYEMIGIEKSFFKKKPIKLSQSSLRKISNILYSYSKQFDLKRIFKECNVDELLYQNYKRISESIICKILNHYSENIEKDQTIFKILEAVRHPLFNNFSEEEAEKTRKQLNKILIPHGLYFKYYKLRSASRGTPLLDSDLEFYLLLLIQVDSWKSAIKFNIEDFNSAKNINAIIFLWEMVKEKIIEISTYSIRLDNKKKLIKREGFNYQFDWALFNEIIQNKGEVLSILVHSRRYKEVLLGQKIDTLCTEILSSGEEEDSKCKIQHDIEDHLYIIWKKEENEIMSFNLLDIKHDPIKVLAVLYESPIAKYRILEIDNKGDTFGCLEKIEVTVQLEFRPKLESDMWAYGYMSEPPSDDNRTLAFGLIRIDPQNLTFEYKDFKKNKLSMNKGIRFLCVLIKASNNTVMHLEMLKELKVKGYERIITNQEADSDVRYARRDLFRYLKKIKMPSNYIKEIEDILIPVKDGYKLYLKETKSIIS